MFSIPFELNRSIIINKPAEQVFASLGDFNQWGIWSPWIIIEPDCPVKVTNPAVTIGHQQEWNGTRIGSGRMELIEKTDNQRLAYDLEFISPWKSQSKTQFELEKVQDENGEPATKVTWYMQGTLPIFLFFMKKMMSAFVGSDYERGLKMLKEYLENGVVNSHVDINGIKPQDGFYYVGYAHQMNADEISNVMGPSFEKLMTSDIPQPDLCLTVVNKFDMVNKQCDLVAAVAYRNKPDFDLPEGMIMDQVPAHSALEVLHKGSYQHLPNGWSTLMNFLRYKKLKANKKVKEYEVYLNDPREVAVEDLETAIYAPIK